MAVKVPLEMDRPLWKIYLFTNIIKDPLVENDPYVLSPEYETKSVMILRYHHSLADGFSFLKLIFKASNYYDVFHQSPLLGVGCACQVRESVYFFKCYCQPGSSSFLPSQCVPHHLHLHSWPYSVVIEEA